MKAETKSQVIKRWLTKTDLFDDPVNTEDEVFRLADGTGKLKFKDLMDVYRKYVFFDETMTIKKGSPYAMLFMQMLTAFYENGYRDAIKKHCPKKFKDIISEDHEEIESAREQFEHYE